MIKKELLKPIFQQEKEKSTIESSYNISPKKGVSQKVDDEQILKTDRDSQLEMVQSLIKREERVAE